jgi:23S rRNA (adenine2503-C2)-methyltransferase
MVWRDIKRLDSSDRNVFKYVFTNEDAVAEAVLYRYPEFKQRTVICCSTMSGCPVGCRFCGSGDNFVRNLNVSEIADQINYVLKDHAIDAREVEKLQFMYMSMGEPMLNFRALDSAIRRLHLSYPNAQQLISTMGPDVPGHVWTELQDLSIDVPTVGLQFSVHESTDEARSKLIPFTRKRSLEGISQVGHAWYTQTGRQPYINYCIHEGNTSDEDVKRLVELFPPNIFRMTISVVCERDESLRAAISRQEEMFFGFRQKLGQAGYSVRVFDPAGQDDIGGGCGQLWHVQKWMKENPHLTRPSAGSTLPVIHRV